MLNEHNTIFARSVLLDATARCFPEPSTQTASASLQPFLQGSLCDRPTDRPRYSVGNYRRSAHASVEKTNSVIVYAYNKYLLEQLTRQIGSTSAISSYIQL